MIFQKAVKNLKSLKFTIFLITCLSSVFFIGLIVPQKSLIGKDIYLNWKAAKPGLVSFLEFLRFTSIYTSPVTIILWALFFLNLTVIMSNRIPVIWKKVMKADIPQVIDSVRGNRNYEIIEVEDRVRIRTILRERGYRCFYNKDSFWAVKNRFSPLATILFHLSFFLMLAGGIVSFYTRFTAEAVVAVGETFNGQFMRMTPPKIGIVPNIVFTVTDVKPSYFKKNLPVDLKVTLATGKGREIIGINRPYRDGALSLVIKDTDISPLFIIRDRNGKEVDGAYVKLKVLKGDRDTFEMMGYSFESFFYTDVFAVKGTTPDDKTNLPQALKQVPETRSSGQNKEIVNPAFKVVAYKGGKRISSGTMRPGEAFTFDDYNMVFKDFTFWIRFLVIKEYGLGIIYTGFALMTIALTIRFFFSRRDLKGIFEGGRLHITGKGEFFVFLFEEEFRRIIDSLKG